MAFCGFLPQQAVTDTCFQPELSLMLVTNGFFATWKKMVLHVSENCQEMNEINV